MRFYFTPVSSNGKLGPIPAVTASADTCPASCPLRGSGCYAEYGPLSILWKRIPEMGISFARLLGNIRTLPRRQIWRYGQAGDLPGTGERVDATKMKALITANRGRPVLCYTHRQPTRENLAVFRDALAGGFTINLSANHPADADRLAETGLPVVTVVPSAYARRKEESLGAWRARTANLPRTTPAGRRLAICPATYTDTTCARCQACSRPRAGGAIIAFPAHGTGKGRISFPEVKEKDWI